MTRAEAIMEKFAGDPPNILANIPNKTGGGGLRISMRDPNSLRPDFMTPRMPASPGPTVNRAMNAGFMQPHGPGDAPNIAQRTTEAAASMKSLRTPDMKMPLQPR